MAEIRRQSVREQLGAAAPAVRGDGVVVRLLEPAVQAYVTGGPPLLPNTVTGTGPLWLWLAPDRALFVADTAAPLPDGFVSEVTDGLAVFETSGPRSAELISGGCTLDPAALVPGRCAQTVFGGVKVLLYGLDGAIRLHVERAFAAFLLEWFTQAAAALG